MKKQYGIFLYSPVGRNFYALDDSHAQGQRVVFDTHQEAEEAISRLEKGHTYFILALYTVE